MENTTTYTVSSCGCCDLLRRIAELEKKVKELESKHCCCCCCKKCKPSPYYPIVQPWYTTTSTNTSYTTSGWRS